MARRKPPTPIPADTPLTDLEPLPPVSKNRPKVPKATRDKVLERDHHQCRGCGSTEDLTIDHKKPLAAGGKNAIGNMQTLCYACNQTKGNKTLRVRRHR